MRASIALAAWLTALTLVDPCLAGTAGSAAFGIEEAQSFVARYCSKCHTGNSAEADLRLDRYPDLASVLADRERWDKVVDYIRSGIMPPDDEPKPTEDEIEALLDWLGTEFDRADATASVEPGRVTIRRLNRAEYNNTIRDLVGVEFEPAKDFPADEVGYGFDNIGDVLALPPALLEKYLSAAEQITAKAIVVGPVKPPVVKLEPGELQHKGGVHGGRNLYSTGEVFSQQDVSGGEYALRVEAYGQQAGPEPARMSVRVDDENVQVMDVEAVEGHPVVYEVKIKLSAGQHKIAAAFINDYWMPDDPDPKNRDRNLVVNSIEIEGPLDRPGQLPESHRRILCCTPADDASVEEQDECARLILTKFATRAYRRPAAPEEVERLLQLVRLARAEGEPFLRGIQIAVEAVLVSPHFLFRVELDPGNADGKVHPLNDYELASRLSYFLWNSMPDEELFAVAGAGRLHEPETLAAQVRRLLADPRSRSLVMNFADQWLQIRNLATVSPNPKQFPDFDPAMRQAMLTETEMFFEAVMREDRSVLDLLAGDFTFVNEKLARHYGFEGVKGKDFRRVSTEGTPRGGLITQASVLTVTSNPTRTSPVKRGRWILEQILGTPPPPPPPGVSDLKDDPKMDKTASLRKRLEQHRENQSCASCHKQMDPLGFGLENFDAIGAWREKDGEAEIDATGELPDGTRFQGPKELRKILLAQSGRFRRCLTGKMLSYALGRGLEPTDRRTIEKIVDALAADGDKFSSLVIEIVRSEPFMMRRAETNARAESVSLRDPSTTGGRQ